MYRDREPVERPADRAIRRANLRRVAGLFKPYRLTLGSVLVLIAISAVLGIVSPFLLRSVLDTAIPKKDTTLLSELVGGMIAISVFTGVLGVAQTWLSNVVGQQVMHDLRAAVYAHLQRLSLGFFTRTRTGEVQSRIANDIGGVQDIVTVTATSGTANLTTDIAAGAAMVVLSWQLSVVTLLLIPPAVLLSRLVARMRRDITAERQQELAELN